MLFRVPLVIFVSTRVPVILWFFILNIVLRIVIELLVKTTIVYNSSWLVPKRLVFAEVVVVAVPSLALAWILRVAVVTPRGERVLLPVLSSGALVVLLGGGVSLLLARILSIKLFLIFTFALALFPLQGLFLGFGHSQVSLQLFPN